ncbi:hypothetical protein [Polynucleobacter sp.]|uniref:hypothetical protein n=1 Tax=Polynucleobacter sp. TaxID=2029855 RepID=UPI003F6A29DD
MSALSVEEISKVLDLACEMGREAIKNKSAPSYSDSTVSEEFLVDLLKQAMAQLGYDANLVNHHGGHAFPDVSITGSGVGIELKGATSNRKFNGNSVVASTMLPNLKKIFLMYWIGSAGDIGYKDYFDCVATPVVTHSPRFQLDIDLDKNASMFGTDPDKVGTIDDVIFTGNGIDSEKIIKWMSDKAKRKGETPWWISTDESLPTGSTGLIQLNKVAKDKKKEFMKYSFLGFPKILAKSSPTKYAGLFEWAIQTRSIYADRDDYSAKGKVAFNIPAFNANPIRLPRSVQVAIDALSNDSEVDAKELKKIHGRDFADVDDFLNWYEDQLQQNLRHTYAKVKSLDTNNIGEDAFAQILADMLISKIDKSSITFSN